MLKKTVLPAFALLALATLLPGAAQGADEAPAVAVPAALEAPTSGCSSPALASVEGTSADAEWLSALGEGPIGGIPYPCQGAVYQYRWNFVGCCGTIFNPNKAKSEQEERFCCPDGSCSVWYNNGQTKCEGTCF